MSDWQTRLSDTLEPLLSVPDPRRTAFSAYHDMPYAIFHYPAEEELALRRELGMLRTRLTQKGKRVSVISLAEVVCDLIKDDMPIDAIAEAERDSGIEKLVEQFHSYLVESKPLADAVIERIPADADPCRDVLFFTRVGFLFPIYRTSALVEHLHGRLSIPSVPFFPGSLAGPAGLCFMDVFPPEHNYRPRIF